MSQNDKNYKRPEEEGVRKQSVHQSLLAKLVPVFSRRLWLRLLSSESGRETAGCDAQVWMEIQELSFAQTFNSAAHPVHTGGTAGLKVHVAVTTSQPPQWFLSLLLD